MIRPTGSPDDGGVGETVSAGGEADRDLPLSVCIPIHEASDITAVSAATSEGLIG